MTHTKARVKAESGLNFDIEPKAMTSPSGREKARVTKKIEISDFKVFSSWETFMIFKWTNLYSS